MFNLTVWKHHLIMNLFLEFLYKIWDENMQIKSDRIDHKALPASLCLIPISQPPTLESQYTWIIIYYSLKCL